MTNSQTTTNIYPYQENAPFSEDPKYGMALERQNPRYVRFSVSYDY